MRSPVDPVSTSTSLTTVQLEVPVAHTVMDANPSSAVSKGPAVTENGNALAPAAGDGVAAGVRVAVAVAVGPVKVGVGTGPFALPVRWTTRLWLALVLQPGHAMVISPLTAAFAVGTNCTVMACSAPGSTE